MVGLRGTGSAGVNTYICSQEAAIDQSKQPFTSLCSIAEQIYQPNPICRGRNVVSIESMRADEPSTDRTRHFKNKV